MVQVVNGEIVKYSLPRTGTLADGRTVSGYHLLPEETLKAEGWLPVKDKPPLYNAETHYVEFTGYDIQKDKVVKQYQVRAVPELEEPEIGIEERLEAVEARLTMLEKATK